MKDFIELIKIMLLFSIIGACIALLMVPQYKQAKSLDQIATNLNSIDQAIRMQTAQQSWLIAHYMKPVRPLYPWEKHRCEWCGGERLEGDNE